MYDLDTIKQELLLLPKFDKQIYLQGTSKSMDPLAPTIGKNYLIADANELDYCILLFNLPYINSIITNFDLVRTRILVMKPKTCYYWHKDRSKRFHIPIETHKHCFLLLENERIHLPADGNSYIVDTTQMHTALNCSTIERIHLVGCFK